MSLAQNCSSWLPNTWNPQKGPCLKTKSIDLLKNPHRFDFNKGQLVFILCLANPPIRHLFSFWPCGGVTVYGLRLSLETFFFHGLGDKLASITAKWMPHIKAASASKGATVSNCLIFLHCARLACHYGPNNSCLRPGGDTSSTGCSNWPWQTH